MELAQTEPASVQGSFSSVRTCETLSQGSSLLHMRTGVRAGLLLLGACLPDTRPGIPVAPPAELCRVHAGLVLLLRACLPKARPGNPVAPHAELRRVCAGLLLIAYLSGPRPGILIVPHVELRRVIDRALSPGTGPTRPTGAGAARDGQRVLDDRDLHRHVHRAQPVGVRARERPTPAGGAPKRSLLHTAPWGGRKELVHLRAGLPACQGLHLVEAERGTRVHLQQPRPPSRVEEDVEAKEVKAATEASVCARLETGGLERLEHRIYGLPRQDAKRPP